MPSSFVTPQQDAFKEFIRFPSILTEPLRPCIIGPVARLTRYSVAAEKNNGDLGSYDSAAQRSYPYPNRQPGSILDQDYTKLFVDNALLRYWNKVPGAGGVVNPVTGQPNQVRAADFVFKSNTNFPRNVAFGDRDVQVGDVVDISAVVAGVMRSKRTSVIGFAADPVFATVSPAVADPNNPGTQAAATTATKVDGPNNQTRIVASSAANYNGTATGDLRETYTIEVVQGSTGGDLRTARLRVTSASGNDNYYPSNPDGTQGVIPADDGFAFDLTPRRASLTFGFDPAAVVDAGVAAADLIVGQKWTLQVTQAWTAVAPTSAGTYRGQQDTTYIVTVLTGGLYAPGAQGAAPPQIMVTTTTGVDSSGPTNVTAAGTAVPIGTQGVTISFSGTGLAKNARFTVPVTGQRSGPQKTLVLQDNLPTELVDATPAPDLTVRLYIRKGTQIDGPRFGSAPDRNWIAGDDDITVFPGITATDPSYTVNGAQTPLPVIEGQLFVEMRQWLQEDAGSAGTVSSVADIRSKWGDIHPDNPLAFGVNLAMLNASGSEVGYGILAGDPNDPQSWYDFVEAITNLEGVYNVAVLTHDEGVLKAYADHVKAQSVPEVGAYRGLWCSLKGRSLRPAVNADTTTDKAVALATVTADPATGLNTMVRVPAGNAKFVTNPNVNPLEWPSVQEGSSADKPAVKAGDVFRFQFTTDGFGKLQWTEYRVSHVVNDDTLVLTTPLPTTYTIPQQFEVWHPLTKSEVVNDLLIRAQPLKSNRVRVVWPDTSDGNPGYFVAAALAGQASGVIVNQGLKNMQLVGFQDLSRSTKYLQAGGLLKFGQNGVWVVAQDSAGNAYTKSAVNTDVSTLENQEEVIVRNSDANAFYILDQVQRFVGASNVVTGTENAVRGAIQSAVNFLKSTNVADHIGPPLINAEILELRQHQVLKDRLVCSLRFTLQYPLNKIQLQVQIVS